MNTPLLQTKRLILRKFTENDLKSFYKIYSDKEANTFLPWYPLKTMEEAKKYMKNYLISINKKERIIMPYV